MKNILKILYCLSFIFCLYYYFPNTIYAEVYNTSYDINNNENTSNILNKEINVHDSNAHDHVSEDDSDNNAFTQIMKLRGELEKLQHEYNLLDQKYQKSTNDLEFRIKKLENTTTNNDNSSSGNKKSLDTLDDKHEEENECSAPISSLKNKKNIDAKNIDAKEETKKNNEAFNTNNNLNEIEKEYQIAYQYLENAVTSGEDDLLNKARDNFEKFIKKYPNSKFVSNSYYWIGQTYTKEKNYNNAAIQYLKGYKANTKGPRSEDNLIRFAESLMFSNKLKESCVTVKKLIVDFPKIKESTKKSIDIIKKKAKCDADDNINSSKNNIASNSKDNITSKDDVISKDTKKNNKIIK